VNLGPQVNSSAAEGCPAISDDGLELYFWSTRSGGFGSYEIWVSRRETKEDEWSQAVHLGATINSSAADLCTDVSPDGMSLIFVSARPGGYGGDIGDLWLARRPTINAPWGPSVNLGPIVNGSSNENGPCLSADGSVLYYSSDRPGGRGSQDMWQVSISPVVDLNADGIVDAADMCVIVDYWGTNEPLCDIGPMPWGDGIVDVEDLKVLAEHLFEQVQDPTLIAHWPLDESEGMFAADSIGDNDAVVLGDIEWQPTGGQMDGALKLDGVSGYAVAGAPLNPVDGPFSIFTWVNGGSPGQVVISQQNATNWLALDAGGNLMTELKGTGRSTGPLFSDTVITDGKWHRIGFVWDGSHRTLYVDGVAVVEDTQDGLEGSESGLNLGAGKMTQPGTFFSGLIDDIRIYNRVVRP